MRVLLVEDDPLIGDAVVAGLGQRGVVVDWVRDGVAGQIALEAETYSAVILDLGLPRRNGLELLRRLRAQGNRVPVLVITARDALEDRVTGLDAGADDFLVKPVELEEIAARLRALVRRSHGQASSRIANGAVEIDPASREAWVDGRPVELTVREFDVLHQFVLNAGRVLTREALGQQLYGWGSEIESNALEVYIHHLRRKIGGSAIRTIRGVGYLMPRASDG